MICPVCFGRKYDFKKDGNSGYFVECKKCHGTGIVEPQTNEEWFCGLSTTEKSEFLSTMVKEAIEVHEKHGITWHETVSWWDGWLREIHNE